MAKLKVSSEVLLGALFPMEYSGLHIDGVAFDAESDIVVIDLTGYGVPDAEEINATVSVRQQTVTFTAV